MFQPTKKVVDYFSTLESKLGYDFILGGIKHFGYYPSEKMDISEKKAQELMQDLIAKKLELRKNDFVLDAGCGQGYVACYLAIKYGCSITGITITPFEVLKAKKLVQKLKISNKVKFLKMDYTKTNFPDNCFDAIYTMETLVHAYDLKKTIKEFMRIVKPNGKLSFFEYSKAADSEFKKFDKKYNFHFHTLTDWVIKKSAMVGLEKLEHGTLAQLVKKIGLTHVKEEDITSHIYSSFEKLYRLSTIPYLIIKLLHLQNYFINAKISAEWFPILLKYRAEDLFRYNIITAEKP